MLSRPTCLAVLLVVSAGCTDKTDDGDDTSQSQDTTEDVANHHPAWGTPLEPVPLKEVGNPIQVAQAAIFFTDITTSVGLPSNGQASTVSFVDFDDDGWPDLVAHGEFGLTFYRNMGGHFKDVTDEVLYPQDPIRKEGGTPAIGDLNGDGKLDIYLASRAHPDKLLLGDGYGHFEPAPSRSGIPANIHAQGVSLADVDNDGDLDVYLVQGRRIDADDLDPPLKDGLAGSPNILLLNDGQAGFTDATQLWGAQAGATSESFGAIFADYDRDGDLDAIVVRDFEPDHFLRNTGTRFEDATDEAIGLQVTSLMGLAVGDYNGDGKLDIYATNDTADYLYQNNGNGTFKEVFKSALSGGDPTSNYTGWGCAFVDLDNDGDQDIVTLASYENAGRVGFGQVGSRLGGWVVLENLGAGQLTDITEQAGLNQPVNGSALAMADFDLDGDIDIVGALSPPFDVGKGPPVETVARGLRLLRNDSARAAGNHFLQISLRSKGPNPYAVGATLDVVAGPFRASRVVTAGESFVSSHTYVQHFGLGSRKVADTVKISWPDGTMQTAHNVPSGYHRIELLAGDCCFAGQKCDPQWPECPLWTSSADACLGQTGCDPCQLICDALAHCGDPKAACLAECAEERPTAEETICTKEPDCKTLRNCLENHPGHE